MEGRMREHVLESTYLQGGYYSMQSDESSMLRSFPDGASGLEAVHSCSSNEPELTASGWLGVRIYSLPNGEESQYLP